MSPQKAIYRMLTWATGTFELDVRIDGERLRYERDEDGNRSVDGTWQGDSVNLEEAA